MLKLIKTLAVLSTLGMLFVLIGGALVTKTESGMGCGDSWPLCHGQLIPSEITFELIIELSHRLVSGGVGFLVLLLSILSWRKFGHIRETKLLAFLSTFFLVLQGLIGAAAVKWGQSDFVLAMHFGISLISFAAILLLTFIIFEIDRKFDAKSLYIAKGMRKQMYAMAIYTLAITYTGALVRHINASLVCGSWPFCNNSTPLGLANFNLHQWIQMGHRLAAGILVVWVIILFRKVMKEYKTSKVMRSGWIVALALILFQVFLGAMIIVTKLNLMIALLHALIVACFFGILSYFILLSSRSARYKKDSKNSHTEYVS
ncbi:COX15/CtaA family protein [Pontibacillus yanchengensis]|uniref:Heme A synthase n=1 Tax=Pontibacillus yanchengensis Y32 TaxID=1385514 RepID=A0A0A2TBM4_9BACI|nr:heme A synthase [Pontibacillus yanchengensis]KGP71471.1 heme A synthase [Pontibacillus yanchengensis Y32]